MSADGKKTNEEEIKSYADRYRFTSLYFVETVGPQWITIITTNKTPHRIWTALKDRFAYQSTNSFYNQLASIHNSRLSSKADIPNHLADFDTQWKRLQDRCSTSSSQDTFKLPYAFKSVMESEEAKALFLLHSLPPSMKHIVDNLPAKDNIPCTYVHQLLLEQSTITGDANDRGYKASGKKTDSNTKRMTAQK